MDKPIEAKIYLVPVKDHAQALQELEEAGAPYCTFPHHSGEYVAIALGDLSKEELDRRKQASQAPPLPPKITLFPGGGNQ